MKSEQKLRIVEPRYVSQLTDVIMELQYLRRQKLGGSTPAPIFFQLKDFFHLLESLNSARIEGNRATITDAIEARIEGQPALNENLREIVNMEEAMRFIETAITDDTSQITRGFILELHKRVVDELEREGDKTPGEFRTKNVSISGSSHVPPDYAVLRDYVEEFLAFVNAEHDPKLDLLRVAIAHHRFAWIHPFNNGNGRVVRLLTYAMLIARGFDVRTGRILNPSAVFCSDRDRYYSMLARADEGSDEELLAWCEYVLRGLLTEMKKIDKLLDYDFLRAHILKPSVKLSLERKIVTNLEARILQVAIDKTQFQASDIAHLTPRMIAAERSRVLARMKMNRHIEPVAENARKYTIRFQGSDLSRALIQILAQEGFISLA
jgi:Fic family protein